VARQCDLDRLVSCFVQKDSLNIVIPREARNLLSIKDLTADSSGKAALGMTRASRLRRNDRLIFVRETTYNDQRKFGRPVICDWLKANRRNGQSALALFGFFRAMEARNTSKSREFSDQKPQSLDFDRPVTVWSNELSPLFSAIDARGGWGYERKTKTGLVLPQPRRIYATSCSPSTPHRRRNAVQHV